MIQFSVQQIISEIKAQIANEEFASALLPLVKIGGISSLKDAKPTDVSFFFSKNYQEEFFKTKSQLIVTGTAFIKAIEVANPPAWKNAIILSCDDPYLAMAKLSAVFSKKLSFHDHQTIKTGINQIHPTAVIASDVQFGDGIEIGPYTVIEAGVKIDNGVKIYPHCYIGPKSSIGQGSVLFPQVTLYEKTEIGKRCRIHSGVVIGSDGFGYAPEKDPSTQKPISYSKIFHLGNVVIEDDVEIGADTSIDRGTFGSTLIRKGVKIDNQVQVGHNVEIGEGSIICGGAGLAGSSSTGKFVTMAGQTGLANQVHIGDYSLLTAYCGATKDFPANSMISGVPARPTDELYKIMALQNKMLRERVKDRKKS
jgi:UDP-3-O-[3-hydroxymyristoyl] glucosamine N-acyltransferase